MANEVLEAPVGTESQQGTPAAAPEPPSLRDQLTKQVEDANLFAEDGTANPEASPLDRQETPQARQARQRGPDGKFARVNKDGSEVPTQEQVAKAQPNLSLDPNVPLDEPEGAENESRDAVPNVDNAPKSWKAVAKEKWATVDPVVRAEVHRREREATKAINEAAPIKKFTEEFRQVIQPHAERYRPTGASPLQIMSNLMQSDQILSTAPMPERAKFMAHLIKAYGIDFRQLDAALAGQDPSHEPMAAVEKLLNERLAPVQGFIQSEQQRREQVVQSERTRAETVLDRMEADAVNFPHFKLVIQDMADVTEMAAKRGVYLTPADAYTRAVAMNPEAQAAAQSRAGQQASQRAHDAATRSLGASLSVSGSPAGVRPKVDPSDLRGTIEAAWDAAQGR